MLKGVAVADRDWDDDDWESVWTGGRFDLIEDEGEYFSDGDCNKHKDDNCDDGGDGDDTFCSVSFHFWWTLFWWICQNDIQEKHWCFLFYILCVDQSKSLDNNPVRYRLEIDSLQDSPFSKIAGYQLHS